MMEKWKIETTASQELRACQGSSFSEVKSREVSPGCGLGGVVRSLTDSRDCWPRGPALPVSWGDPQKSLNLFFSWFLNHKMRVMC